MSKQSPKQRYEQLISWLPTLTSYRAKNSDDKSGRNFSKADHYKKVNKHYGGKKVN